MKEITPSFFIFLLANRITQADPESSVTQDASGREHTSTSSLEQQLLTKYLLSRLLDQRDSKDAEPGDEDQDSASSIIYPQVTHQRIRRPIQKILDQAKDNIDVIDFRNPDKRYFDDDLWRYGHKPPNHPTHKKEFEHKSKHNQAPSEPVSVFLPFPGTEPNSVSCNMAGDMESSGKLSSPPSLLSEKKYYFGIFFKANWFRAEQYCRFHGMHLASVNSVEEQKQVEEHVISIGMGDEHFWTSGTDQAKEGSFFWMSTGKPITYENWNSGEPNNFLYENGEKEHCLELWNRDGKGLKWNDTPCSFQTFFICEL